jgi:hypothetical protein
MSSPIDRTALNGGRVTVEHGFGSIMQVAERDKPGSYDGSQSSLYIDVRIALHETLP